MYSKKIQNILKRNKIKIGDSIRVKKAKNVYEGILMPRIELGDTSCLVIKLNNGYNTGIKFEKGIKIEKIRKGFEIGLKHKKEKIKKIIFDKKLPTISILGTGGTIASKVDYRTGGVYASFSPRDIATQIPELKEIANIKCEEVMNVMSEDMTPEIWVRMAKEVAQDVKAGYKGIIVTHGTDTLHYTAAALSFMLRDLPCPVALVGSQRSSDRGSSDAVMNVACAANFVAHSDVAEVCTVMHGSINDDYCLAIRGTKSRKMHTSRRDAFRPINEQPIAKIYWKERRIEILNKNYRKRNDSKLKVDTKLNPKVALIKTYPGMDPGIFDFYLSKRYKGFVVEATGLGHTPTLGKHSLLPKVERVIKSGLPVVITSQCLYGRTHPTIYYNLRELSKRGAIFGEDMLPEVALVKLMWVLGHTKNLDKIRDMMLTNYSGEINPRIEPKDFLV
jgi:glutamyl-tRNA(Gln) amidotransferase subunit D